MLPIVLQTMVQSIDFKKEARWIRSYPNEKDLDDVKEAGKESVFDPLLIRSTMLKNNPEIKCRELLSGKKVLAKVIIVSERKTELSIPWNLFKDIFLAFGFCKSNIQGFQDILERPGKIDRAEGSSNIPWKVILFASPIPRIFPEPGVQPTEAHINGGYAYPGKSDSIVIYRLEECVRVLVHELLHACGSDSMENPEWKREALTETYAELFLTAILSKGSLKKANLIWKEQSQWISDQEYILTTEYGVQTPEDYAYRYTVGRRDVLKGLGIQLPSPSENPHLHIHNSLRFTSPFLYF
jgi:hypothetical protein